jgi:hypothetical protein
VIALTACPPQLPGGTGRGRLLPTPDTGISPNGHGRRGGRPGNGHECGSSLDAVIRTSEAVMLKETDCRLPRRGWGRIDLAASAARAGKDWTDDGTARQARGLKHRAQHETRTIPIPPLLAQMLRNHLKRYGTAPDGRIFQTVRGGHIQDSAYSAVWAEARAAALTPAQHAPRSPPGPTTYGTPACPWP